ncbi:hypothetical protein RM190_14490 [Paracoccus sp. CPCC 101403]|uniref:Uncharacterized protein n=1 Tax=Paracoccus broussonetiae TaxID=3075834 RepID=A0ABU3EGZ0_9RHOB|nr:hypothetical protein [Paracoccus sp. CPCC 101403]MDT1063082.1 hypothetical protein [Paracoccus sp. CPCC 101403]
MTSPDDEAQRLREQLHRNQIITAVIAAALVAFVVAAYLGAFSRTEFKEIPDWVSALTSVVAAAISAYAVYLVARTLEATKETLKATQEMAADTKRIGDAQIRPWVLLSNYEVINTAFGPEVLARFANYGFSPALQIFYEIKVECYRSVYWIGDNECGDDLLGEWIAKSQREYYLVPSGEDNICAPIDRNKIPEGTRYIRINLHCRYGDLISGKLLSKRYSQSISKGESLNADKAIQEP